MCSFLILKNVANNPLKVLHHLYLFQGNVRDSFLPTLDYMSVNFFHLCQSSKNFHFLQYSTNTEYILWLLVRLKLFLCTYWVINHFYFFFPVKFLFIVFAHFPGFVSYLVNSSSLILWKCYALFSYVYKVFMSRSLIHLAFVL